MLTKDLDQSCPQHLEGCRARRICACPTPTCLPTLPGLHQGVHRWSLMTRRGSGQRGWAWSLRRTYMACVGYYMSAFSQDRSLLLLFTSSSRLVQHHKQHAPIRTGLPWYRLAALRLRLDLELQLHRLRPQGLFTIIVCSPISLLAGDPRHQSWLGPGKAALFLRPAAAAAAARTGI